MESVFQQLWAALDRILPFLGEPWRQIVGMGVPTAFLLVALYLLARLALRPLPKTAPHPVHHTVSARVSAISSFLRHTLPSRLDSRMAARGTQAITRELLLEIDELRRLKFQMTADQANRLEAFIHLVEDGVNDLFDAIKEQAAAPSPDISKVNAELTTVTDRVDQSGRALVKLFG
jgi:hypothetical protein